MEIHFLVLELCGQNRRFVKLQMRTSCLYKLMIIDLPLLLRMGQLDSVLYWGLGNDLVNFDPRDVAADALVAATAKVELPNALHFSQPSVRRPQPTIWVELVWFWPKDW